MKWWIEHGAGAEAVWLDFLGKCFRECRANLRWSIRELATKTGISPSHLLRIESGEYDFTITKFLRLAEVFALPAGRLLEPPLFASRHIRGVLSNLRNEKEFQELAEGDCNVDDSICALILALLRRVIAMHISSNPAMLLDSFPLPFPGGNKGLKAFAVCLDNNAFHMDRLFTIQALLTKPFAKLKSLGLVDTVLIRDYLEWSKTQTLDVEYPAPDIFILGSMLAQPLPSNIELETVLAGMTGKKKLTEASTTPIGKEVKPQLPDLLKRLRDATQERGKASALAKDLGIPKETVSRYLSGKMEPGGEVALKLQKWVEGQERRK